MGFNTQHVPQKGEKIQSKFRKKKNLKIHKKEKFGCHRDQLKLSEYKCKKLKTKRTDLTDKMTGYHDPSSFHIM